MGKPKFPGLQERFEHFLQKEFNEGNAFLPGEIFSRLSGKLSENLISSEEYDDLKKNSINYIRRAIEKEILTHEGFGKRGYRIFHEQKDGQIDDNGKPTTCKVNGELSPQKNNFIESFVSVQVL